MGTAAWSSFQQVLLPHLPLFPVTVHLGSTAIDAKTAAVERNEPTLFSDAETLARSVGMV